MSAEKELRSFAQGFESHVGVSVRENLSAKQYCTLAVGGAFEYFVEIRTKEQLQAALKFLSRANMRPKILGFGSNSLFPDNGVSGWTIKLHGDFRYMKPIGESNQYHIGAGSSLMSVTRKVCDLGLSGLEFAGGIPGTFGGAVRMNAGAHGEEIADRIESITCITPSGEYTEIQAKELRFEYRSCSLPHESIITDVVLKFVPSDTQTTKSLMSRNLAFRKETQPLTLPSSGSTFRNPRNDRGELVPAGKLLEDVGMKGVTCGGAEVSTVHANWVVNPNKTATANDIRTLIKDCQERVRNEYQIELVPEVVDW